MYPFDKNEERQSIMKFKDLRHYIKQYITPILTQHGYTQITGNSTPREITFRKVLDPWYIFITFRYSHFSSPDMQLFKVQTMRLNIDEPYQLNIRDKQGIYIPGSLVGNVSPVNRIGWEYYTPEDLTMLTDQLLAGLLVEMQRLEDLNASMNYD